MRRFIVICAFLAAALVVSPLFSGDDDVRTLSAALGKLRSLVARFGKIEKERTAMYGRLVDMQRSNPNAQRDPEFRKLAQEHNKLAQERQRLDGEIKKQRSAAVSAVRALVSAGGEEKTTDLIKALYRSSPDLQVEEAAIDALAGTGDITTIDTLIAMLGTERRERTLIGLCEVMKRRKEKKAVEALVALLKNRDWDVVVASAKALAAIRSRTAVEPLIEALQAAEEARKDKAARGIRIALQDMTGQYSLNAAIDFRNWWNSKGKEGFDEAKAPPTRGQASSIKGNFRTVLYGDITSKRVIFICDVSHSMSARGKVPESAGGDSADPDKNPLTGGGLKPGEKPRLGQGGVRPGFTGSRIEILKIELAFVVSRVLTDDCKFNVITYSTDIRPWKKSLTKATKKARESAVKFVKGMEPLAQTNTYGALEAAFKDREVDTIYFLSDGNPTVGTSVNHDEILAAVRRWNKGRNIIINTIGLLVGKYAPQPPPGQPGQPRPAVPTEDKDKLVDFLKKLAAQNGGVARIIRDD